MTTRVLSPATARSAITLSNGQAVNQLPGTSLDLPDALADQLVNNGWTKVGTVGPTTQRPSSNPNVGAGVAQQGSLHMDTSLGTLVIFDGVQWRSPANGTIV